MISPYTQRFSGILSFLPLFTLLPHALAVTVYTTYSSAATPSAIPCIGAAPCDGNVLTPIHNPSPGAQSIPVQLLTGGMAGMGIPVSADFQGFSIEISVANQLVGNQGNDTNVIFLNLMSNMVSRAGRVLVRLGGNSQEDATVVPNLSNNEAIFKVNTSTFTPVIDISPNLVEVMGNISKLTNVDWFIGLPFNDTANPRLELAEIAQSVLGDHLLGMQLGNEPDLYYSNGIRPSTYTVEQYFTDWGTVLDFYLNDSNVPNKNMFIAPSVCCGQDIGWTPELVWNTGFLSSYANNLAYMSVEHYPTNNCNDSGILDPEQILGQFVLNHSAVINLSTPYINSTNIAQGLSKPFIMFETNTASCGGFSGLSDSFASALWAVDYNMNMASANFTNALYHVGGMTDSYYNPFTPPPTNQTSVREWTVGPTYYSALFTAEAFTTSNKARVIDLLLNGKSDFTPGYAIYEDGQPTRAVLINYLTDPGDGSANYTAYISVGGNQTGQAAATPSQVFVKYLLAPSTSDKWNITWGRQSFGGPFASDGRIQGTEFIYTFACDTTNNVCPVPVPGPGAALVFLSSSAQKASEPTATVTFSTSVITQKNHATIDPAVLATFNGQGGQNVLALGSTSQDTSDALSSLRIKAGLITLVSVLGAFGLFILRR